MYIMATTPIQEVNPITEENYEIIRSLKKIGPKMGMKFGFVSNPAEMKGMYAPLMRSKKLRRTDADIRQAVYLSYTNPAESEQLYGHISDWDMSSVTDMSELFAWMMDFNENISRWDVSNVTNMHKAFFHAHTFNQNIGGWDVSKVVNMDLMFCRAQAFNQPIGGWDVSKVVNMSEMFEDAQAFNQPIGGWDVSSVTDMSNMFSSARAFNEPIGDWNVSNVTNMNGMFRNAHAFNQPTCPLCFVLHLHLTKTSMDGMLIML